MGKSSKKSFLDKPVRWIDLIVLILTILLIKEIHDFLYPESVGNQNKLSIEDVENPGDTVVDFDFERERQKCITNCIKNGETINKIVKNTLGEYTCICKEKE